MNAPPTAGAGGGATSGAEALGAGSGATGGSASTPGAAAGAAPGVPSLFSAALATLRPPPAAVVAPPGVAGESVANAASAHGVPGRPAASSVGDAAAQALRSDPGAAPDVPATPAGSSAPAVLPLIGAVGAMLELTSTQDPKAIGPSGPAKSGGAKRSSPNEAAQPGAAAGAGGAVSALAALVMGLSATPAAVPVASEPSGTGASSSPGALNAAGVAGGAAARLAQPGIIGGFNGAAATLPPAAGASTPDGSAPGLPQEPARNPADSDAGAGNLASAGAALSDALRLVSGSNTSAVRTVALAVHDRQWPLALATQVMSLVTQKLTTATLRLTPAHLGPVDVRIDMRDLHVNVNFGAAQPETRSALEQALPQLRAMMAGAGLTLGDASVQQHSAHTPQPAPRAWSDGAAPEPELDLTAPPHAVGLIDEYV